MENQLQDYTIKQKDEALIVTIVVQEGEKQLEQQLIVFRGFTSSLSQSTPFDPEHPVIPPGAEIKSIDRVKAPYNPQVPQYIDRGLTWAQFQLLMQLH